MLTPTITCTQHPVCVPSLSGDWLTRSSQRLCDPGQFCDHHAVTKVVVVMVVVVVIAVVVIFAVVVMAEVTRG